MNLSDRLTQLLSYLDTDPNNTNLRGDIIDIYLQIGPLNKAEDQLNKGLRASPENPRFHFQSSTLYIAQGHYSKACDSLRPLLDAGIDNPGVRYNLALALSMTAQMEEARTILSPICDNEGLRFFAADLLMVRLQHHTGDLGIAIQLAQSLLKEEPNNGDLLGVLSLLYLDTDERALALTYAEQSQLSSPKNTESLSTIGHLALEDYESSKAKQCFEDILSIQAKDGRAWLGLGLSYLLDQEIELGEKHLITATEYMPSHLGTWNTLAWLRILKKDLAGAMNAIDNAMERDRTFSETHGTLAVIQAIRNEQDEAERSIKIALRLDPQCISAHFARTLLMSTSSDKESIELRISELMNRPIAGGVSMKQGLQRYASKTETPKRH